MMTRVLLLLVCLALCESYLAPRQRFDSITPLFDARKDAEREEQWRIQQEILAKRKNPKLLEKKKLEVEERRKQVDRDVKKTMWGSDRSADNLDAWKAAKEQGLIKDLGYEEITPEKKRSVFGFSIPLVTSPIDLPGYDNGQRFDLRLPYAERGYEDPEADVMGKFFSLFSGKKKETTPPPSSPPPASKASKKK